MDEWTCDISTEEMTSVESPVHKAKSPFAPYAAIFARESWSLGTPQIDTAKSTRHRIEEDSGAPSGSSSGNQAGGGSSWLGGLAMKLVGTQAQPYDRLDAVDEHHATSSGSGGGGGGGGSEGGGGGRGGGGMRPGGRIASKDSKPSDLYDDDSDPGAQFSTLRFLQFCGSG